MKKAILCVILCFSLTASGCAADSRILEDLGMVQTTSYDLLPDGMLSITASIPMADPEASAKREVLTVVAENTKNGRIKMSRETQLILVSGQIRNALYGLSMVKNGIYRYMDTLIRDPSISPELKISIVEGNAGELLRKDYDQHPRTGKYIDHLLEKESSWQTIPRVTILSFLRDLFDDGIDPITPIIKDMGNSIKINGIALFQDDRYVAKIPADDTMIFAFLKGSFKEGEINVDLSENGDKKEYAMLSSLVSGRKLKVSYHNQQIKVRCEIKIMCSILEFLGDLEISNEQDRNKLERRISDKLTRKADSMIALLKQHKVDSLGLGSAVRNKIGYSNWKKMNWREEFPHVEVENKIKVVIKDFGEVR